MREAHSLITTLAARSLAALMCLAPMGFLGLKACAEGTASPILVKEGGEEPVSAIAVAREKGEETAVSMHPIPCEGQEKFIAPLSRAYSGKLDVLLKSVDPGTIDSRLDELESATKAFSQEFSKVTPDRCDYGLFNFLRPESEAVFDLARKLADCPADAKWSPSYATIFLARVVTDGHGKLRNDQPALLNNWLLQLNHDYCAIKNSNRFLLTAVYETETKDIQKGCLDHLR